MNPLRTLEPGIPPPFQFAYRGDLLEEMCIDDAMKSLPVDEAEAAKVGLLYGRDFDQEARNSPMAFIESMMMQRGGGEPTKRVAMGFLIFRGQTSPTFFVENDRCLRTPVEIFGPLTGLYQKLERLLGERGLSPDSIRKRLYVSPVPEDSAAAMRLSCWMIGYERGTGFCALLPMNTPAGSRPCREFTTGKPDFTSFDLSTLDSIAK